jgi:biopolymer transport protein ExbB
MGNTEEVSNPYGIAHVWREGDYISRSIIVVLLLMSVVSWIIIITKVWDQRRMRKQYQQLEKNFWTGGNIRDGLAKLSGKDNAFREIAEDGLRAAQHHEGRLTDEIPLHEWITVSLQRSVDSVTSALQGGLSFLATTGSTAPFIGLMGTVWGILQALINIGVAGQADIGRVAGPVGEALIMTFFGLFVAVPAVLGYNWLLRRNKSLIDKVRYFATDMHSYLVSGARVDAQAAPKVPTAASAAAAAAARK